MEKNNEIEELTDKIESNSRHIQKMLDSRQELVIKINSLRKELEELDDFINEKIDENQDFLQESKKLDITNEYDFEWIELNNICSRDF